MRLRSDRGTIGQDHRVAIARVLFTCRPLAGHYEPLVPLATAAKEAGHAVAFATGDPYDERARRAGFEAFRVGPSESFRDEWAPRFPGFERLVGDEQRRFFLTEIFANLELEPRAAELEAVVDEWAPQLVVHEVAELAAPLISSARGIPYVDVSYGRLIPRYLLRAGRRSGGAALARPGPRTRIRLPGCSSTCTWIRARRPCRTPRSPHSLRCRPCGPPPPR